MGHWSRQAKSAMYKVCTTNTKKSNGKFDLKSNLDLSCTEKDFDVQDTPKSCLCSHKNPLAAHNVHSPVKPQHHHYSNIKLLDVLALGANKRKMT